MELQRIWLLPVSLLLCGMIGYGGEPVVEMPKSAIEEAVAAQKECSQRLGFPAEITNSIGMKLKLIPAGEFMMGSHESPDALAKDLDTMAERFEKEHPLHRVRITRPFYLGVYEVTQAEYEQVVGTNPSYFSKNGDKSDDLKDMDTSRFPVERLSWENAVEYCRNLSDLPEEKAAGRIYRLPTEAEWEYACRAGTTSAFHFGSHLNGQAANCDGNYPHGTSTKGPYLERPTTVGSYAPNAFGLYDMHGNVLEWCNDWYAEQYYGSSPESDPQGPSEATSRSDHWELDVGVCRAAFWFRSGPQHRVFRGGGWWFDATGCRAAFRCWGDPQGWDYRLGFRVAAVPPSSKSNQNQAE